MRVPYVNYLKKLIDLALKSTLFFYKENLPYKLRFLNRKLSHKKILSV